MIKILGGGGISITDEEISSENYANFLNLMDTLMSDFNASSDNMNNFLVDQQTYAKATDYNKLYTNADSAAKANDFINLCGKYWKYNKSTDPAIRDPSNIPTNYELYQMYTLLTNVCSIANRFEDYCGDSDGTDVGVPNVVLSKWSRTGTKTVDFIDHINKSRHDSSRAWEPSVSMTGDGGPYIYLKDKYVLNYSKKKNK